MSWQDTAVIQLRHAINDVDDPQRYTDNRLSLAWLVGANYVVGEFTLNNAYLVNLASVSITPDPVDANDAWMVNLTTLRSAIMMISNDLKLAINSSFSIKDVHMQADMREIYKGNKMILDEVKKDYDNLRMQYCMGVKPSVQAVLTPINIISAGYRRPNYPASDRDRMIW